MMDLAGRTAVGQALLADDALPAAVTEAFFARHPEWVARFGALGRRRCTEDARLHLSFLAGAVQAGRPELFVEYARWCGDMLAARNIERSHLAEHFELVEEHLTLDPEARALVREALVAAGEALARPAETPAEAPDERTPLRLAYLSAALAGRRGDAWEATREAIRAGLGLREVYRDVLVWTQRRLGQLWADAKISVAQEHMASAVTHATIARLYPEIGGERTAGRALIAGCEGELHSLPAHLAADLLELDGWDVVLVGTHAPEASVLAAVEAHAPDVLGLSATMAFSLPRTVSLARAARAKFGTLPIVLGGRALAGATLLASELGVDVDHAGDLSVFAGYRR